VSGSGYGPANWIERAEAPGSPCAPHDGEWASWGGLLLTRPQRTAADLLRSREDPEAVAQVIANAVHRGHASPGGFAAALAPGAAAHGFRRGDGMSVLQWRLDLAGDPDSSRRMSQAGAPEQAACPRAAPWMKP
jgi:hypothetical protein